MLVLCLTKGLYEIVSRKQALLSRCYRVIEVEIS